MWLSLPVLRNAYFTKFESILKYGIIFCGGSLKDTETVFKMQKKCLRVIKGVNNRASCRSLYVEFRILTVAWLYIFQILCFIIKNRIYSTRYSDIHSYNTIHKYNFCMFNYVKQRCCKKSVINMGIEIFSNLLLELKSVESCKVFKEKLKSYLLHRAF
jgi:hypothetical protein